MRRFRVGRLEVLVGALLLAALAWTLVRGQQNHTLQADEYAFGLAGARSFAADFLGTLLAASPVNRGPERLMALILWVPYTLFDATPTMFRAAHVTTGALYLLAALPAYALARLLRLERWQAGLVAALAVVTPWLLYGTTLLNVTVAYPLTTALVWAVVRAVTRPAVGNDVLVLVIAALGATARTGSLPFVAVAAVAVLVQVWRSRPAGEGVGRFPLRVARTHPVLVGAGALSIVVVLALGVTSIIGGQYKDAVPDGLSVGEIVSRAGLWGSILALGSGYVVVMVALPWAVRQAVRPADPAAGAFAVTALALFAVFVVSTLEAPPEERYVAVLAALAPVAFGAALFRRETSTVGVLIGGLVVLRIVTANVPAADAGSYAWMVAPARQFSFRFLEGRATAAGVPEGWDVVTLLVIAAIVVAVALTRLPARLAIGGAAAVAVAVVAVGGAQAQYNADKWLDGEGSRAVSWEDRAFVDVAVGDGLAHGWDYNPRSGDLVPFALARAQVYNRRVGGAIRLADMPQTWSCCDRDIRFSVDAETGRVQAPEPLPRYVLAPPGFQRVGFAARFAAGSPALAGFGLFDLGPAPRVSYVVTGAEDDGAIRAGRRAVVRAFTAADGAEPACARIELAGPPGAAAAFRVGEERGTVEPDLTRVVNVRLGARRELVVSGDGELRIAGLALVCGP